ncbi:type IV secretion system protein [Novosphingobium colocasiae]|uniref:Type VI secretion protein n=1 Tax=Novosphingobium colocasiae TaxID=1256513 RepID=A0A918UDQ7_9SPHN|nr:type IV secretion system protein [Novosphingobium colocasiae]GGY92771.1 hypothetical protein GCM10011614_04500 [Novosphingobium colocasiae]
MSGCQQLMDYASAGVAPALHAVDCAAGQATASAFNRLFGAEGAMAPVLTIVLTLYIAFFAFSLLTGRSTLGISALTPRMLTLGLVLTFATSWIAYQSVVWNLAVGGPDWIASLLMGEKGSATQIFGDRIDLIFTALGQVAEDADQAAPAAAQTGAGATAAAAAGQGGLFSPTSVMWMGGLILLLGTVGVLLTARIALAVLLALGPLFVIMAMFGGTRGLTAGWVKGVALTALTPLFVVLGGGISLELLAPVVSALVKGAQMGEVDARAAMALFVMACVHLALMVMVFKVAGTMVAGWRVFGLADGRKSGSGDFAPAAPAPTAYGTAPVAAMTAQSRTAQVARSAAVAGAVTAPDGHGGTGASSTGASDRRTVITHVTGGGINASAPSDARRAHGIGSRFRGASNDTMNGSGRAPAKELK